MSDCSSDTSVPGKVGRDNEKALNYSDVLRASSTS